MDTRRKLLKKIGLGTAAAGLVVSGRKVVQARRQDLPSEQDPAGGDLAVETSAEAGSGPWWLLAPLKRGDHLGAGWFVAHLGAVDRGASVLTLQSRDGDLARVHLCQRSGEPRGLAHTEFLDFILMDGGQGDKQTPETLGRVLMGLASVVADNELRVDGDLAQLGLLQPHGERVDAYGPETLT